MYVAINQLLLMEKAGIFKSTLKLFWSFPVDLDTSMALKLQF